MHLVDAIAARVRQVSGIRYVGTTGEFSAAEAQGFVSQAVPAVYIGIPNDTSTRRDAFSEGSKKTDIEIQVWTVALDVRASGKGEVSTGFLGVRDAVMQAIEGYTPEQCVLPLVQVRGQLFGATKSGNVIYEDTYSTQLKARKIYATGH